MHSSIRFGTQTAQKVSATRQQGGKHTIQARGGVTRITALERAGVLNRAQKAADKVVKAPWLIVLKGTKVKVGSCAVFGPKSLS